MADAICGWIILLYRRKNRAAKDGEAAATDDKTSAFLSPRFQDAMWWLYNPLAINICTRGSAESLVVLLPVLCTVWIALSTQKQKDQPSKTCVAAVTAGLCHGVAIHAKLYPVIYTLSFMTAFVPKSSSTSRRTKNKRSLFRTFCETSLLWARRLFSPAPLLFGFTSVATFVGLTYAAVLLYGDIALQEGLLYHFSRVDHRHNYSMHWYWIYLARDRVGNSMASAGRLLLIPQLILLAYTSLGIAPTNLSLALFVQTFLFVAHNKVITAQYFTWYLCLLPLCSDQLLWTTRSVQSALLALGASIVCWLGSAYCLEMQGMAVHMLVWMASVVFFMANVNLLGALLVSSSTRKVTRQDSIKKKE